MQVVRTANYWSGVLIAVMLAIALAGAAPVGAQDAPPVTYERYDVHFDVRPDGSFVVRGSVAGPRAAARALGETLAEDLLARGAAEVLHELAGDD